MTDEKSAPGKKDGWYWGRSQLISSDQDFFGPYNSSGEAVSAAQIAQRDGNLSPNLYKVKDEEIIERTIHSDRGSQESFDMGM